MWFGGWGSSKNKKDMVLLLDRKGKDVCVSREKKKKAHTPYFTNVNFHPPSWD